MLQQSSEEGSLLVGILNTTFSRRSIWQISLFIGISTNTKFLITFIYGRNHEEQRGPLWEDIQNLSNSLEDPWVILGDFNAVLHQGDRIGGVEVTDGETKDFTECTQQCNLHEFQYEGAFFSWTNKTVWSKIDRAFHNDLWYEAFSFTHVQLLSLIHIWRCRRRG